MKNNYIDNILVRLKRKYSKDEFLMALYKKLSDLETENGKLNSYIQELEYNNESKSKLKKEIKRLHKLLNEKL